MPTARNRKLEHLAAILVLLVWNNCNGNHNPAGVLAVPAIVVMGDSTVDVGVNSHINTIIKADWPPYGRDFADSQPTGRFCNGKLIPDFIAERLGHQPPYQLPFNDPNAEGEVLLLGTNTASSGSGFSDETFSGLCVPLSQQVEWVRQWRGNVTELVGEDSAASLTSEAVFVFSTGSNDWVNSYYINPSLMQQYNPTQYTEFLIGILQTRMQEVYDLGARRIALVSLPPFGCVPFEMTVRNTGGACIEEWNNVAAAFNIEMQNLGSSLEGTLPGTTIVYLDSYTLLYEAVKNPLQIGISDTDPAVACCDLVGKVPALGPLCNGASPVCANADEYVWWDAFHPTQIFNEYVGNVFYETLTARIPI